MAKLVIIDDEKLVRVTLRKILESAGHEVIAAANGQEGLDAIVRHHPDLVLCDVSMPKMNGKETLSRLRQDHPQLAEMPFLFLSAHADRNDVIAGLDLGADDYLTKPIDADLLVAKVAARLREVGRMEAKKAQEHVKLYKALTRDETRGGEALPEDAPHAAKRSGITVALVGRDVAETTAVAQMLAGFGHEVTVTESGKAFLRDCVGAQPHVAILWFYTADMLGSVTAKMARNRGTGGATRFLLAWSPALTDLPRPQAVEAIDEIIDLPIEPETLNRKTKKWAAEGTPR